MKSKVPQFEQWVLEGHYDPERLGAGSGYIQVGGRLICSPDGAETEVPVANIICVGGAHRADDWAHARLAAAAPDLLHALELLLPHCSALGGDKAQDAVFMAKSAVAKAK